MQRPWNGRRDQESFFPEVSKEWTRPGAWEYVEREYASRTIRPDLLGINLVRLFGDLSEALNVEVGHRLSPTSPDRPNIRRKGLIEQTYVWRLLTMVL